MELHIEEKVSMATTQTEEEDAGDPALNCLNGDQSATGFYPGFSDDQEELLPGRGLDSFDTDHSSRHGDGRQSVFTQTEELDPVTAKGQQLSYLVIQDLALDFDLIPSSSSVKDDVHEALCRGVSHILHKQSALLDAIMNRANVVSFRAFESIANELFNFNTSGCQNTMSTWGRVISLFAFTVRVVQEHREEKDRVNEITKYLASYVSSHVVPFVSLNGGWDGLLQVFPAPAKTEAQIQRTILWFCLCVGILSTFAMYVSSLFP